MKLTILITLAVLLGGCVRPHDSDRPDRHSDQTEQRDYRGGNGGGGGSGGY